LKRRKSDKNNKTSEGKKMKFEDFTEMPVWKIGFDLLIKIYKITKIPF